MSKSRGKALFFRGKWRKRAKAKAKALAKKAWKQHRQNAKQRRSVRKTAAQGRRADNQRVRQNVRAERSGNLFADTVRSKPRSASFWARHSTLADLRDAAAQRGHQLLDRRDLRSGIITQDELDALNSFSGPEEWRQAMLNRRRERYAQQRARDRDIDHGPLYMVYGSGHKGIAKVQHVGFRPPAARPSSLKKEPTTFQAPNRRVRRVKRKDRVPQIVKQWEPKLTQNARNAMAADGNLSGALATLQSFAESYPERRSEVHDHLGKMAEFGKGFSGVMETFIATLTAGKGEDNPGMPPEVVNRLKPLTEMGPEIAQACQEFVAAYEDYFAEAIKAAQDEYTPSKQALTS